MGRKQYRVDKKLAMGTNGEVRIDEVYKNTSLEQIPGNNEKPPNTKFILTVL